MIIKSKKQKLELIKLKIDSYQQGGKKRFKQLKINSQSLQIQNRTSLKQFENIFPFMDYIF